MPGNPVRRKPIPETDLSAIPGTLSPEESRQARAYEREVMKAYRASLPKGDVLDFIRAPINVMSNSTAGLLADIIGKGKQFEDKYAWTPKTQAELDAVEAMLAVMGPGMDLMDYLKIPAAGPGLPTLAGALSNVDRAAARLTAQQAGRAAANAGKAVKKAATSDDMAYALENLAQKTGFGPKQIIIGPSAKTFRHDDAALAAQMEREGKNRDEIWQATKTYRAPDQNLKQELHDWWMEYTDRNATDRQGEAAYKRYKQALERANANGADPEEIKDINDWWDKTKQDLYINSKGTVGEYVNHPKLKAAYPQLFEQELKQIEPTHPEWTIGEGYGGFFDPRSKAIAVNTGLSDEPKRSVALHELQHAIQDIEGWSPGTNSAYMAAKMAERDIVKKQMQEIQDRIDTMRSIDPVLYEDLIRNEEAVLSNRGGRLYETRQLEGITDPDEAYRRAAGEEEARMTQKRLGLTAQEREQRPPYLDYETDPSLHITDFATGGEVRMGGGGKVGLLGALARTAERGLETAAKAAKVVKAAPQDEALRLAQFRATLPPAQGGLGLPANNTPEQRAEAMKALDWFHGTERLDRLLEKKNLDPRRATSGPMPFGTNSPALASSYAMRKADTSRKASDTGDVKNYFQVFPKSLGQRGTIPYSVEQSWHFLSPETKSEILEKAKRVGYENFDQADGPFMLHPEGVNALPTSENHWNFLLNKEAKGNPLSALRNMWVDSGNLYGNEEELARIYKLAGYPYEVSQSNAPWSSAQGVMTGKVMMSNPIDTGNLDELKNNVIPFLQEKFKKDRSRLESHGVDQWAKNSRYTPKQWVNELSKDLAGGDVSYVWTSIPDKITGALKELGYNGIIDKSGKGGGVQNDVLIPFAPEQVRSRFAAFDPWRRDAATAAAFGVAAPDLLAKEKEPEDRLTIEQFLKKQGH